MRYIQHASQDQCLGFQSEAGRLNLPLPAMMMKYSMLPSSVY